MSGDAPSRSSNVLTAPRRWRGALFAALCLALCGALLLGAGEALAAYLAVRGKLRGQGAPIELILAAVGKAAITHLIFWTPALLIIACLLTIPPARRSTWPPWATLSAAFVLLAGMVVIPADLELANRATAARKVAGVAAAALLAALVYWFMRRRSARSRSGAGIGAAPLICGALAVIGHLVTGWFLFTSPFAGPGAFRAPLDPAAVDGSGRPHVLWIVLDTTRADHMSLYGHSKPTTPHLDALASRAIVFDRAIADGMWTVPSHAAMFTGLSMRQHGTGHRHLWLDDGFETLAEALAGSGYVTGLFSNNPLVSPTTNLTQGFETKRNIYELKRLSRFSLEYLCEKYGLAPPLPWLDDDFGAALTNWLIERWLDRKSAAPKFVFVNYMEAHLPYRAPQAYRRMTMSPAQVARSYALRRGVHGNLLVKLDLDYNLSVTPLISADDAEVMRGQYDAAIRYLDDRVAELLELFSARGMLDNTLVIITADHGENLGEKGLWGHRFLTYQTLTHVPLVIREPGRSSGQRVTAPVQLSDIYTTVVGALLDTTSAPSADNRDLLALARGDADSRPAIAACDGPDQRTLARFIGLQAPEVLHRATPQLAIVADNWKYIRSLDGWRELFDLDADPHETRNLADAAPEVVARLDGLLNEWLARTPEFKLPDGQSLDVSPEALQTLKALGYVGD